MSPQIQTQLVLLYRDNLSESVSNDDAELDWWRDTLLRDCHSGLQLPDAEEFTGHEASWQSM